MKFIWIRKLRFMTVTFILLTLYFSTAQAGGVPLLVSFDSQKRKAKIAHRLLSQKWMIPSPLIELRSSRRPCQKDFSRVIHICFKNSGKMILVKYDKEVVDESFRVFFPKIGEGHRSP